MKLPVFVYGTLREGQSNYAAYLEGKVTHSQPAYIENALLYHFGAYPGLVRLEGQAANAPKVQGEVMFLDEQQYDQTMVGLDYLEGCADGLYVREQATVHFLQPDKEAQGAKEVVAWIYLVGPALEIANGVVIETGDWVWQNSKEG